MQATRSSGARLHDGAPVRPQIIIGGDRDRAVHLAGQAGGTGPERLLLDDGIDNTFLVLHPLGCAQPFPFEVLDELLGGEGLLRKVGRAAVLAAAAAGAGIEIEYLPPGEASDLVDPELLCVLEVLDRSNRTAGGRLHTPEEHVEGGGDDVQEPAEDDIG